MNLNAQQTILAMLCTDPRFRELYFADPAAAGRELGDEEMAGVLALDLVELERFASSLVWKRLREVEKHLPVTRHLLGARFRDEFFAFATDFLPAGDMKHYEDAAAFCRYIENGGHPEHYADAARYERARLAFNVEERRFAACRLYTIPPFQSATGAGRRRKIRLRIAVWFRFRGRVLHGVL